MDFQTYIDEALKLLQEFLAYLWELILSIWPF
jgi:hypothetical protein